VLWNKIECFVLKWISISFGSSMEYLPNKGHSLRLIVILCAFILYYGVVYIIKKSAITTTLTATIAINVMKTKEDV